MCTRCPLHAAGTPHALGALSLSSKSTEPAAMRQQFCFSALSVTQAHQSPAEDEGQLVLRGTAEHTGHTATPPCRLQRVRGQNLPIPSSKNFQAQSKTLGPPKTWGTSGILEGASVCAPPQHTQGHPLFVTTLSPWLHRPPSSSSSRPAFCRGNLRTTGQVYTTGRVYSTG